MIINKLLFISFIVNSIVLNKKGTNMKKNKINYFVDLFMLIAFLFSIVTGIIKFPGFMALFGISLRRMPMPVIMKIHDWAGVSLAASVLLHIILHLKWILRTTGDIFKRKDKKL